MKLNFLLEYRLNEIEGFAFVSMLLGACIFLVTCFWDNIIWSGVGHREGWGVAQIMVMALSGLYTFWAWYIIHKWGER